MNEKFIEKKVFLDNLPIIQSGRGKGGIDWLNSIGKRVKFIYDDIEGEIEIIEYIKGHCGKVGLKYKDNPKIIIFAQEFKKGNIKPVLLGKRNTDFKFELEETIIDDKRNITIINRKRDRDKRGNRRNYYKYRCNKCNFDCGKHWSIRDKVYKEELWITEAELTTNNVGCSCCCHSPRIVVENINSIYHTDEWMIPFMDEECAKTHTHSSRDKIFPLCTDCEEFKETPIAIWEIYQNRSMGCGCKR